MEKGFRWGNLCLPADYYAIVSRSYKRPIAEVYAWTIRQPLPTIPIPLKRGEPDVMLDLQAVFTTGLRQGRIRLPIALRPRTLKFL
jgi:hypothetical protein